MAENGIPKRGSDDVMAVWNAKGECRFGDATSETVAPDCRSGGG